MNTPNALVNQGQGMTTATTERALKLLGNGVSAEQTAAALGVTPARISQLLADESFSQQVSEMKYQNLLSHSERDSQLDTLEDKLINKIEHLLPLVMRPMEAIKALQVVNGAKRRGSQGLAGASATQNIVQIAVPTQITQKFVTNIQNQVIQAGDQQLLTIQSGTLLKNITAENPETVSSIQQSNAPSHSFNSTALAANSSLENQNDAREPQRISGDAANSDSKSLTPLARSKQEESRVPSQISFIPVGS